MKPWTTLETAEGEDGQTLVLQVRDGVYVIRVGGRELMSSARHGSEDAMARAGLERCRAPAPQVLVGGLGLGFTLRATLELLPTAGRVVVAEISPAVVAWNQGVLAPLARAPLSDARVRVKLEDVRVLAAGHPQTFDAILLDVDNGPAALARRDNRALYSERGLASLQRALRPGGTLVVWSAGPSPEFLSRLSRSGMSAEVRSVPAHKAGGTRHVLFIARQSAPTPRQRPRRG